MELKEIESVSMKYLGLIALLFGTFYAVAQSPVHPANNEAFLQDEVAEVWITVGENDLNTLLGDSLYTDHHFSASFEYKSSSYSKVIDDVGFRVRGNTSRNADKKAFKVSFNEYISGQKFKGIEKMNLIGQHNDPSLLRYWMRLKVLNDNGLVCSRRSFVQLYINGQYKGLYLNVEHIDDEFLQKRFIDDDEGNLYKCYWGSDMTYWGTNPTNYYDTYELKTNKSEKDYSGLIQFLSALNSVSDADFPCFIEENFEVDLYLKTLAVEMIIGHWDGHSFNKNNFYLYQQPSNGKFVFIEYDMDNTFGIDWIGIDWSTHNLNNWHSGDRPLVDRLLSHPYYKDQFNVYLEEILNDLDSSNWYTVLKEKQAEISASVQSDSYYNLDYGFEFSDFLNALDSDFGAHVKDGIAEYLDSRISSGLNQVEPIQNLSAPCADLEDDDEDEDQVEEEEEEIAKKVVHIFDVLGRESTFRPNTLLVYIYDDGTSERIIQLEE